MSLSKRLRDAALERARREGHQVDDYVLEPDGVIDLRAIRNEPDPPRPSGLSAALANVRARDDQTGAPAGRPDPADLIDLTGPTPQEPIAPADPEPDSGTGLQAAVAPTARPVATCPQCGGSGSCDLFDRFSQTEFYSCDSCMHMWQQKLD